MTDKERISEEDKQLFRSRMQGVSPLNAPKAQRRGPTDDGRETGEQTADTPRREQADDGPTPDEQAPDTPKARPQGPRAAPARRARAPEAQPAPASDWRNDPVSSGQTLSWRGDEVRPKSFNRLRRGKWPPQGEPLDLHGQSEREAERSLLDFLAARQGREIRCVLVIHGKGDGQSLPVLKNMANAVLRQHSDVLAFCSAQQPGATYVLLRAHR